ncbi:hypothetical protein [Polynucleobacter necessarius]
MGRYDDSIEHYKKL